MRETWLLYHHNRVPDGQTDRKQKTHRLRNDRKQGREKDKCQSGKKEKTKIDHKEGGQRVTFYPQRRGERREKSILGKSFGSVLASVL